MIEKVVEIGDLFDFYGRLLSKRQYSIVKQYYIEDFSLSEIGENLDISRQAVFDTLKRAEDNLYDYENKLQLIYKFRHKNEGLEEVKEIVDNLRKKKLDSIDKDLLKISKIIEEILEGTGGSD